MMVQAPIARPYAAGDWLDFRQPLLWTLDDVLSPEECRALIARITAAGLEAAPITTAQGFVHRPDIRNNRRALFDDADLAADLYRRAAASIPVAMNGGYRPVGANERFRCYRYDVGQRFAPHYDGAFVRSDDEESLLTFMVYLNDDFRGGTTDFPDLEVRVTPKTGRALLFQHRQLHEGCAVEHGVKYVLRSDVMYRRGDV
jgi:hypothetical protein